MRQYNKSIKPKRILRCREYENGITTVRTEIDDDDEFLLTKEYSEILIKRAIERGLRGKEIIECFDDKMVNGRYSEKTFDINELLNS